MPAAPPTRSPLPRRGTPRGRDGWTPTRRGVRSRRPGTRAAAPSYNEPALAPPRIRATARVSTKFGGLSVNVMSYARGSRYETIDMSISGLRSFIKQHTGFRAIGPSSLLCRHSPMRTSDASKSATLFSEETIRCKDYVIRPCRLPNPSPLNAGPRPLPS